MDNVFMTQYLKIYAQITNQVSNRVQTAVEQMMGQGLTQLHLLICTQGGSVYDGITIYNYLKILPVEITTYNFGSVDSIGVPIYCLGKNRISSPFVKFSFHPVYSQITINSIIDENTLKERLKHLKREQSNIINIIASTTNKNVEEIQKLVTDREVLGAEEAQKLGLVTKINEGNIPMGAIITSIYDNHSTQQGQPFSSVNIPFQNFIPAAPSGCGQIIENVIVPLPSCLD